jgi:4-hydroxybenzoate polyprenyltransferase
MQFAVNLLSALMDENETVLVSLCVLPLVSVHVRMKRLRFAVALAVALVFGLVTDAFMMTFLRA